MVCTVHGSRNITKTGGENPSFSSPYKVMFKGTTRDIRLDVGTEVIGSMVSSDQWLFSPTYLVGGFNPFEKYSSNWTFPPGRGENTTYLKPPSSYILEVY